MKVISKLLMAITGLILLMSFSTLAVDDVSVTTGGYAMMSEGSEGRFAWGISFDLPTGINSKAIDEIKPAFIGPAGVIDTTYIKTYDLIFRGAVLHSAFEGTETNEVEVSYAMLLHRKTLGLSSFYADFGTSLWEFGNSQGGNETLAGYYVGAGVDLLKDIEFMAGAHLIPIKAEPDLYVIGLQLGIEF